jgi:hypothetical protein
LTSSGCARRNWYFTTGFVAALQMRQTSASTFTGFDYDYAFPFVFEFDGSVLALKPSLHLASFQLKVEAAQDSYQQCHLVDFD